MSNEPMVDSNFVVSQSSAQKDDATNDECTMEEDTIVQEQPTVTTASESATTFTDGWKDQDVEDGSVITFDVSRSSFAKDELSGSVRSHDSSLRKSGVDRSSLRTSARLSEVKIVQSRNSRAEKAMEELTINKLKISSLGLIGRDQEKLILQECYERLCSGKDEDLQNELILIKGYSGIGKSALARTLQKQAEASNGVFVAGKYEFTSTDEPYSGVAQAFGSLCNHIFDIGEKSIVSKLSSAIRESMKEEAMLLMGLIPEIGLLLDDEHLDAPSLNTNSISAGREHERWKYAFRTFTRILCVHFSPIIVMLDDLQWADISSLDIVDNLISDVQNPYPMMIIGCYRSNEVDENSILYNRIHTLQEKSQKGVFQLTEIELQNCDIDSVNKIIMEMMSIDSESTTQELAEVCFKRTLGNPFFLIEFMRMLNAEGFVEFNLGMLKWVWKVAEIEDVTMSTENVVDLLKGRMQKLDENAQLLLQYAACLGATFSVSILKFIWREHAVKKLGSKSADIYKMLKIVRSVQLVERCGSDELRWVHDKVQEAALSLSDLITPFFQFDLGMCLYQGLEPTLLEPQIFDVADLVNKGRGTGRLDVALLNLRAAKKARKMAALQSASKYTNFGIEQLPEDKWTLHRQLTLQLYSLGAAMEYALGHIDRAEEYIGIILSRDDLTGMETLPLKKMKAQILATAHLQWHEACDYGLVILKDLGFNFVWSRSLIPVQMLIAINKMAKRVKQVSVEDVQNMPLIKDKKQVAIIDILKLMKHLTYSANTLPLCFLCVCKVIEMTLDHGVSLCSADCFATFGGVLMFLFKDHAAASHVCELAFAFQKRSGRRHIADTMHGAWAFVLVQIKPLHEGLHLTMEGYSQGMRDGDPLDSTNCLINRFVLLPYMMGRPLVSIVEQFPKIGPQLEESGIINNLLTLKVWWQMMVNLQLRPSEAAKRLEGEQFRQSEESAESNMYVGNVNLAIGELLLYFGDHEARAKRLFAEEKGKTYSELVQGYPPHGIETFHRGITWYAMARKTGKRKYKSKAKKVRMEIKKWVEKGNPNAMDYGMLLTAEDAVLNKNYKKADECYKKAIIHAARIGHMAHAALYNERFAEFRLEAHGDRDDYEYHLKEAIRFYTAWGALGKADLLRQTILDFQTSGDA